MLCCCNPPKQASTGSRHSFRSMPGVVRGRDGVTDAVAAQPGTPVSPHANLQMDFPVAASASVYVTATVQPDSESDRLAERRASRGNVLHAAPSVLGSLLATQICKEAASVVAKRQTVKLQVGSDQAAALRSDLAAAAAAVAPEAREGEGDASDASTGDSLRDRLVGSAPAVPPSEVESALSRA